MKHFLCLAAFCASWTTFATAQTVVVRRNVNLRTDPSTDHGAIESLYVGDQLQLLEPNQTSGYYHVKAGDGKRGWVWSKNTRLTEQQPSPRPTLNSPALASPQPALSGDLFTSLINARKPAVGEPLIENGNQVCGPTGDATNATAIALNTNKNRTDLPGGSDYVDISWGDLESLPSDRISDFVSAPVRVTGFLSHKINVENRGSGESTNCHLTADNEVDWHIYLTESPAQQISSAIIVETTPRTRPQHKWTTAMLAPLVDSQTLVRISGWLMYDTEHVSVIGKQRATVWEVHPITRIEIQTNGQWVDLDNRP